MMVFTSVYGVVDGLFVSNFAGDTSFAAINLIMPFVMILGGIGFMIGTGGTALVAKVLGEGDRERANRYFSMMISLTVGVGVVLSLVGVIFMPQVSLFLGANEEMLPDCILYGRIVTGFTVTFMLQNVFQSFLIAAEKPHLGLICTLAAGFANMILDALFVAGFQWGVAGAAIATGISQSIGGLIPFFYFVFPNSSLLRLRPARPEIMPILHACANGSSELMSNVSHSVVGILYNFQLLKYIGQNGVSARGVLMYVEFIFIAVFIGYSIACAPIVGFHFGAGNRDEMHNILKKSVILMSITGTAMALCAFLVARPLATIFVGYNAELCDLTTHAFRLAAPAYILTGLNIFASSFFTALNNGGVSATISFLRTLVFQSASVLLLPLLVGVDGIWYSAPFAEVVAFTISLIFLLTKNKKYHYLK